MIRFSVRSADKADEKEKQRKTSHDHATASPHGEDLQFPSGGRAPPSQYREVRKSTSQATAARTAHDERLAKVEYGNCWYHDAAVVEEAEETWER